MGSGSRPLYWQTRHPLRPESLWSCSQAPSLGLGLWVVKGGAGLIQPGIMLNVIGTLNGCSLTVDKSKARPNVRNPTQTQTQVNGLNRDSAAPDSKPLSVERLQAQCARSAKTIQELKRLLLESNCRFEAITVVLQRSVAEVSPHHTTPHPTSTCHTRHTHF